MWGTESEPELEFYLFIDLFEKHKKSSVTYAVDIHR